MTPVRASKKVNQKTVFSNLLEKREKNKPKQNSGDFVRTADIKKFSVQEIEQITATIYIQQPKQYMIQLPFIESILYPKGLTKLYSGQRK